MAIANYGELKQAIRDYINYGDASVENNLELFIRMAYDNINSSLRIPSMEYRVYHTVTTERLDMPIPTNYLELKRIYYPDTLETMDQVDIETMPEMWDVNSEVSNDGRPTKFARDDGRWLLNKPMVIGTKIYFVYWRNIEYPIEDADTDVFIQQVDGVLLYRSLAEAFRFLEDFETSEYWMQKAVAEITIVQENADTAEVSGSVIVQSNNPWY